MICYADTKNCRISYAAVLLYPVISELIFLRELLFAVLASVNFLFLIGKEEDVGKLLLDGSDASGVPALDDILYFLGKLETSFLYYLTGLDDIYGDVVIDKSENVEIESIDITFNLQDIFLSHYLGTGILDYRNRAIHLVEPEMLVNAH